MGKFNLDYASPTNRPRKTGSHIREPVVFREVLPWLSSVACLLWLVVFRLLGDDDGAFRVTALVRHSLSLGGGGTFAIVGIVAASAEVFRGARVAVVFIASNVLLLALIMIAWLSKA